MRIRYSFNSSSINYTIGILLMIVGYIFVMIPVVFIIPFTSKMIFSHLPINLQFLYGLRYLISIAFVMFQITTLGIWTARTGLKIVKSHRYNSLNNLKPGFVLYLRAFYCDNIETYDDISYDPRNHDNFDLLNNFELIFYNPTFENNIVRLLRKKFKRVIGLLKPSDKFPPISGADRIAVSPTTWQTEVKNFIDKSSLIFVVMGKGKGLIWELDQILQTFPEKLLIAIPPLGPFEVRDLLLMVEVLLSNRNIMISHFSEDTKFLYIKQGVAFSSTISGYSTDCYKSALNVALQNLQSSMYANQQQQVNERFFYLRNKLILQCSRCHSVFYRKTTESEPIFSHCILCEGELEEPIKCNKCGRIFYGDNNRSDSSHIKCSYCKAEYMIKKQ
jgi:hypothetical protein